MSECKTSSSSEQKQAEASGLAAPYGNGAIGNRSEMRNTEELYGIASSETSSALSVSVSVSGSELKTYGEPQLLLPRTSPMSMAKSALTF